MKKLEYTVEFVTPAFLGNAEQNGQWRTPPFKVLLRQWWRVLNAYLSEAEMRKKEGEIFGSALDDKAQQSRVRIRLNNWSEGKMKAWPASDPTTPHPEVKGIQGIPRNIGSHLYLGYGPLEFNKGTKIKKSAAIQSAEKADLSLIVDDKQIDTDLLEVMQLSHWFGTLGGRARNGWGSAKFIAKTGELLDFTQLTVSPLIKKITAPLDDCLNFDYPTSIGLDAKGQLIWTAKTPLTSWEEAMRELARIKIALRTGFGFANGKNGPLESRHILSYPITNHNSRDYEKNARLPNQLRYKVHKTNDGTYLPVAFHFPIKTPPVLISRGGKAFTKLEQLTIWQQAHQKMDELMRRVQQ